MGNESNLENLFTVLAQVNGFTIKDPDLHFINDKPDTAALIRVYPFKIYKVCNVLTETVKDMLKYKPDYVPLVVNVNDCVNLTQEVRRKKCLLFALVNDNDWMWFKLTKKYKNSWYTAGGKSRLPVEPVRNLEVCELLQRLQDERKTVGTIVGG